MGHSRDGRFRVYIMVQHDYLRYFPKCVLDASAAVHYYEAILATLAILIWHMYSVVLDPDIYPADRVRLRRDEADGVEELPMEQSDSPRPIDTPSTAISTETNEPNGPD